MKCNNNRDFLFRRQVDLLGSALYCEVVKFELSDFVHATELDVTASLYVQDPPTAAATVALEDDNFEFNIQQDADVQAAGAPTMPGRGRLWLFHDTSEHHECGSGRGGGQVFEALIRVAIIGINIAQI